MQRLQNANNAAAAQYADAVVVGLTLYMGFQPIGSIAPATRSPGRPVPVTAPWVRTGRPCGTVCQFANCPNIGHGPYRYTPDLVRLGSHRPQSRHGVTPSHLKPLSTLDLLGLSPIAAGIAQFLTYCLAAALWTVAVADWLTADQPRQIRLLSHCGHTQAAISRRLGVSRYAVRKALS
jgi:hypothetical protein